MPEDLPPVSTRLPDFGDAVCKVERANAHIAAFATDAERYFAKRPYQAVQTPDIDTGQPGYHLYERLPFPSRGLALLVGDAVHNLRAALDHLVCACALAHGGDPTSTQFPILQGDSGLGRRLKHDVGGAGPRAIEIVRGLTPSQSGNPKLFSLHMLDVIDKHRLILPLACAMDVAIQVGGYDGLPVVTARGRTAPPARTSCFIPAPAGYENALAHDFSFTGDVIFPPDTPLAGEPCVKALYDLSAHVADIVAMFENGLGTVEISHAISRDGRVVYGL